MKCIVPGCKNYRIAKNRPIPKGAKKYCDPSVRFFRLPNKWVRINEGYGETRNSVLTRERRQAWIEALTKDQELTEAQKNNGRVCSRHFTSEKPSSLEDKKNPDWVPHLHMNSENCCYGCSRKCHVKDSEEKTKSDVNKETPSVTSEEVQEENPKSTKDNQEAVKESEPIKATKRCRTCLAVTDESKCLQLTSILLSIKELKNMLKDLVGPMDLGIPDYNIMCLKCEKILKLCYSFKTQCYRIEDSIKSLKNLNKPKSKPKEIAPKRKLRSSVKTPKRFRGEDESATSKSSRSAKQVQIKEENEDTEEEIEEEEKEDVMLIMDEIERDIRSEVNVDSDIIDLIRNEISSTKDSDIKDFLKSKFKSEPGVKIVPYVIPRQVICVTPNMAQKIKKNVGQSGDKAKETENLTETEKSARPQKIANNTKTPSENHNIQDMDDEIDIKVHDIKTVAENMENASESEDDGKADDYFENFEPDWFKANDKKRNGKTKKLECQKVSTKPIVYTGKGSYEPRKVKPNVSDGSKVITDSKQNRQINTKLTQLKNTENTEIPSKLQENKPEPKKTPTQKISSKELEAILEGHEYILPKKKEVKIFKVDITNKLKTYSKEDANKSHQNSPGKLKTTKESQKTIQIPTKQISEPIVKTEVEVHTNTETTTVTLNKANDNDSQSKTSELAVTTFSSDLKTKEFEAMEEELTNDGSSMTDDTFNSDILDRNFTPEIPEIGNTSTSPKIKPDLPKSSSKLDKFFTVWSELHKEDEKFLETLHGPRYPCNKCKGNYNTKTGLRRHLRTHYSSPLCPINAPKRRHRIIESPCDVCGIKIRHASSMYRHMKRHSGPQKEKVTDLKPSPCNLCGKVFPSVHSLKLHERVHKSDRSKYFTVRQKQETADDNLNGFKCFMCAFETETNTLLKNHYLTDHSFQNQNNQNTSKYNFQCELCDSLFETEDELKDHVQTHFGSDETESRSPASSTRHRTPSDGNSYEEICNVFVCSKCGQGFSEVKALTQHVQDEHAEEDEGDESLTRNETLHTTEDEEEYEFGFPSDEED